MFLYKIENTTNEDIFLPINKIVPALNFIEIDYTGLQFCNINYDFLVLVENGDLIVSYNSNIVPIPAPPSENQPIPSPIVTNNIINNANLLYDVTTNDDTIICTANDDSAVNFYNPSLKKGKIIRIVNKLPNNSKVFIYDHQNNIIAISSEYLASFAFQSDGTNWILISDKFSNLEATYSVGHRIYDFKSLEEAITWLSTNMIKDSTLYISGIHNIEDTITIDLPFALKISGSGFDSCKLNASAGLTSKPMFILKSDVSFVMMTLNADTLANYGNLSGEDGIVADTDETYHEIKDCGIYGFNKGIKQTAGNEFWVFESEITDCITKNVEINSLSTNRVIYRSSETDYSGSPIGIDLVKATDLHFTSENDSVRLASGNIFVKYDGTQVTYVIMAIKGAIWNEIGEFINGFDFNRTDGRDSNIEIMYNIGIPDSKPHCKINVMGNVTTTDYLTPLTFAIWTKAVFINTSTINNKLKLENNRMTYLSTHKRNMVIHVDGNVRGSSSFTLEYALIKNGDTSTLYGRNSVTIDKTNRSFTIGTIALIPNMNKNDYLELWYRNVTNGNDVYTYNLNIYAMTE